MLADYRRTREQLAEVHRALLAVKESVTNPDGLVTATVGPRGNLVGLVIADAAYQRYRAAELSQEVVRTVTAAAGRAAVRANDTLRPVLPADSDPAALLAGRADLQPAELVPEPPPTPPRPAPRQREDDEDSFEEQTWMNHVNHGSTGRDLGRRRTR
jgi:hypothetical protein